MGRGFGGRGGFRGGRGGQSNDRRRTRSASPPGDGNNNNSSASGAKDDAATTAASNTNFEVRRIVAAAFAKFSELAGLAKETVMVDVFTACDSASFFDPETGSAEAALAELQARLCSIFNDSTEIAEWAMERCRKVISPQPQKPKPKPQPKPQQQQRQVGSAAAASSGASDIPLLGMMPDIGGPLGGFVNQMTQMMLPQFGGGAVGGGGHFQRQQHQRGGGGGSLLPVPGINNMQGNSSAAVLPNPGDSRVVILTNLTEETANDDTAIRTAIGAYTMGDDIVKNLVTDAPNKRCFIFTFDHSQAMMLRSLPPGGCIVSCPQSRFVECSGEDYEFAVGSLRDRVRQWEKVAKEELEQILGEEQGMSSEVSAKDATLREELAQAKTEMAKYETELSLLEGLAASGIPGQAERLEVVRKGVESRKEKTAAVEKELAEMEEGAAGTKRPVSYSTSSKTINNPRAILYFSGFGDIATTKGWSDDRVIAFLKHIPHAAPLAIWRSDKATDLCVELAGGSGAAFKVVNALSYNNYSFLGIHVHRQPPSS